MNNLITKQEVESIKKRAKRGEVSDYLRELALAHGDILSPHDVVDAAKDEESPIHHLFEWDNEGAGRKYRLMQARILLTTVKVTYMGEKHEAFFNTRVSIGGTQIQGYFPIERVMSDETIHRQVLKDAVRDLEFAQKKYETLQEIRGIINTRKLQKVKKSITE